MYLRCNALRRASFVIVLLLIAAMTGCSGLHSTHSTDSEPTEEAPGESERASQDEVHAQDHDEHTSSKEDVEPVDSVTFIQSLLGVRVEDGTQIPVCSIPWVVFTDDTRDASMLLCEQYDEVDSGFETGSLVLFVESNKVIGAMHHPAFASPPTTGELVDVVYTYIEAHGCERESSDRVENDVEFSCAKAHAVVSHVSQKVGIFYVQSPQHLPHVNENFQNLDPSQELDNRDEGLHLPGGGVTAEEVGIEGVE